MLIKYMFNLENVLFLNKNLEKKSIKSNVFRLKQIYTSKN